MRHTSLALAALALSCGDGVTETQSELTEDTDQEEENDDLVTACDRDGDGWIGAQCGGPDCEDENPDINPGATDQADGIDRDCDGYPDLSVYDIAEEPFFVYDGWSWNRELSAFGGVISHLSGTFGSRQIQVGGLGGPVAWATQNDFFVDLGDLVGNAIRIWTTDGPLDVFQIEQGDAHALVVWKEGELRVLQLQSGSAPERLHAAADAERVDAVTCDGSTLRHTRLGLNSGSTTREAQAGAFDRCLSVIQQGRTFVLAGTVEAGPIVRYEIDAAEGFTNFATINPSFSFDLATAATTDGNSVFAFGSGSRIWIFEPDGNGSFLDVEGAIVDISVGTDGRGSVAVTWTTDQGTLGMAWGEVGGSLTEAAIDILEPDTPMVTGVEGPLLTTAWIERGRWRMARSFIPEFPQD